MAPGATDRDRTAIIHRVRSTTYVPRPTGGRPARPPRRAGARRVLARMLQALGWTIAIAVVGTGLGFAAFGITLLIIDPGAHQGNPHVIIHTPPAPTPVVRR